jgi:hypothetical protein
VSPTRAVSRLPLLAVLAAALSAPLSGEEAPGLRSVALQPRSAKGTPTAPLFTRLGPEHTRLGFSGRIATLHEQKRLYLSAFAAGSLALGDLDGDSLTDLFVAGGGEDNRLYLQGEDLTFVDVTAGLPIEGAGLWSSSAVIVDIDHDGDNDLHVCHYDQPNQLFLNQLKETGKLAFIEAAKRFGLDIADASLMAAFADYDLDGDLDLFLLTHRLLRENGRPAAALQVQATDRGNRLTVTGELARYYAVADHPDPSGKWTYREHGRPDLLYRNDNGVFRDVTTAAGLLSEPASGTCALWWDFDEDGWPDLYVGNEDAPHRLYRNSGKGTFTEVGQDLLPSGPTPARGCTTVDANGDGHPDLLVGTLSGRTHYQRHTARTDPGTTHNALYLSTGTNAFLEGGWLGGLARTGHTWSVVGGDLDLDGREDVFFTTGSARHFSHADLPEPGHEQLVGRTLWDVYETTTRELRQANLAFRGSASLPLPDVSAPWGLDLVGMSYSCAPADLDNDGDLDLTVCGLDDPVFVFRNDSPDHHSIRLRLEGAKANRPGIGARIVVTTPMGRQTREIRTAHGYLTTGDGTAHFGLGPHRKVSLLQVHWPGGTVQEFRDLPADRLYTVTEPAARKARPIPPAPATPLFAPADCLAERSDAPPPREPPSLPIPLSRLGPCQAWADVDGDGKPDLYLGGTPGKPGRLLYNRSSSKDKFRFTQSTQWLFDTHADREDTTALFFDANGDGLPDLYVGSGARGQEEGDATLRDRLYINEGSGYFDEESFRLPDLRENTSTLCAADFDRDGDLDLFTGFLGQPGAYPLPAGGRLLQNQEGREFTDVTTDRAPGLDTAGRITGSLWTDCDGDGWPELVVAQDRGPILIHANRQGTLSPAAPASPAGHWNAIAAADLDQDGDMDLAAANWGLNHANPAGPEAPDAVFAGDLPGDEPFVTIEAYREDRVWYPRRGLSFWRRHLPGLFPADMTHHQFASRSLEQLFSLERLRALTLAKAVESRSGFFTNDGHGRFTFTPFPAIAQIAPAFGLVLEDFDRDGLTDCYLAQNHTAPPEDFGPMAGGVGQLLRNTGLSTPPENRFLALPASASGIQLPGDGRSAVALDLNADDLPDLVTTRLGQPPSVLLNQRPQAHPALSVSLRGPARNLQAVGARIVLQADGLPLQSREIRAGEGFRSGCLTPPVFVLPRPGGLPPEIRVLWPDGTLTRQPAPAQGGRLEIPHPSLTPPLPAEGAEGSPPGLP